MLNTAEIEMTREHVYANLLQYPEMTCVDWTRKYLLPENAQSPAIWQPKTTHNSCTNDEKRETYRR